MLIQCFLLFISKHRQIKDMLDKKMSMIKLKMDNHINVTQYVDESMKEAYAQCFYVASALCF